MNEGNLTGALLPQNSGSILPQSSGVIVKEDNTDYFSVITNVGNELIAAALSPAEVSKVLVDPTGAKACKAIVPDSQLSLAIGNKGQNVRLAARLTGWKIDIGPESQAEQIIEEMETLRRETQEQIDKAVEDLFADEEF